MSRPQQPGDPELVRNNDMFDDTMVPGGLLCALRFVPGSGRSDVAISGFDARFDRQSGC